ncbi:methanogen output domain 1-containing protein [Microcoleus sp. Pol14D5]
MSSALPIPPNEPAHTKDVFLRTVLRELTGILEQTVGEREAEAYVNYVGLSLGRAINSIYRDAFSVLRLDPKQVAAALVDLKARIDGNFTIESMDSERIILVSTSCPFGEKVIGRPSLCRMTNNVFGVVTAENLGYARVEIPAAIARGDSGCRVVINLIKGTEAPKACETEFFGAAP